MTTASGMRPARRLLVLVMSVVVVTSVLGPAVGLAAAESEPNDTRQNAEQIQVGNKITGDVPGDDSDWFAFTVQKGETINISAAAASGDGATDLTLFTPDGDSVASAAFLSGERASFGTTATTSGTYYVKARATSPNKGGQPYNFTVNTYRTDAFEPNERRANATEITVGEKVSGTKSLGDKDWFAFTVQRGETINVSAAVASATIDFTLFTPDGNSVASARVRGSSESFGTTARTSGTYYVKVDGGNGEYNFTVNTYRTDAFEPNERRRNATRLYENPFPGDGATISIGDRDRFAFTVKQGATINVSATDIEGSRGNDFTLFTPDGNSVAGARLGGSSDSFGTTATTSGTYYLQVRGTSPERGGDDYNFTVAVPGETLGLPNDQFERPNPPRGNQDRANATAIDDGVYRDLAIVDDDRDVLAVDLRAGERVSATIDFTHAENDLQLAVTDAAGTTLARANSSTDGEQLGFTASSDGTYYLVVSGQTDAAAHYDLVLEILRTVNVTVGPGSTTLAPGNATTVTVTAANVGAGLSTANLTLSSSNTSVVTIQSVSAAGSGSVTSSIAADGGSATVNVTNLDARATRQVPLVNVTLASAANGTATVSGTATLTSATGADYPIGTVQGTTVTVEPPTSVPPVVDTYDGDDSGTIDNQELLTALADYPDRVSPTDLLDLLAVYEPGS